MRLILVHLSSILTSTNTARNRKKEKMTTKEAVKDEAETTTNKEFVFEVGMKVGKWEILPEFSGLLRCDAGCNTPSAALFLRSEENKSPMGFCGHHFRKYKDTLNTDSLYALKVKKGEESLSPVKGGRAG